MVAFLLNLASLLLSFPQTLSLSPALFTPPPVLFLSQTDYSLSFSSCLSSLRHVRPLNFTILMSGQNPPSLNLFQFRIKSFLLHKVLLYLRRQPPQKSFFLAFIMSSSFLFGLLVFHLFTLFKPLSSRWGVFLFYPLKVIR